MHMLHLLTLSPLLLFCFTVYCICIFCLFVSVLRLLCETSYLQIQILVQINILLAIEKEREREGLPAKLFLGTYYWHHSLNYIKYQKRSAWTTPVPNPLAAAAPELQVKHHDQNQGTNSSPLSSVQILGRAGGPRLAQVCIHTLKNFLGFVRAV